jgi:hypothetical protein
MLEEIVWQLVWLVVATLCTVWDFVVPFYWLGVKVYALFKSRS